MRIRALVSRIRGAARALADDLAAGRCWKIAILPPPAPSRPTRYVTVAAMMRNEGPYLQEWLDFHRRIGVDHFVLYDNGSTDDTAEVCRPYVRAGLVTLVPWANFSYWFNQQRGAYAHALANFGASTTWMGFFDLDEFMFPVTAASLRAVLQPREAVPVLAVAGVNFGTSGHRQPPPGGILRNYRMGVPMHLQKRHRCLLNTKCFVRPERIEAVVSAHWFRIRNDSAVGYTEHGVPLHRRSSDLGDSLSVDVIRYNHYFTRSRTEFEHKAAGSDARGPYWSSRRRNKQRMFVYIEALAEEDRTIERWIGATRPSRDPGIEVRPCVPTTDAQRPKARPDPTGLDLTAAGS